jgi:hypothetical protein
LRAVRADLAFQLALVPLLREGGHLLHFHSATPQVIDWKGLARESQQQLPSEQGVLTVWRRDI